MKSVLFVTLGLLLAAVAVSAAEEVVRDEFGFRPKNLPVDMVEDYDPEKETDFVWFSMDKETAMNAVRQVRDGDVSARADIVVEKPLIIPFGRAQVVNGSVSTNDRARSFVFNKMDKHEGKWILYPYNFTYIEPPAPSSSSPVDPSSSSSDEAGSNSTNSSSSSSTVPWRQGNQTLPDGAMISTMGTEDMPLHTYMNWIESKTDMNLKKAKVVYDMNIAVLQVQADREADDGTWNSVDITYDSDGFCTAFYNYFYPKYNRCFVGVEAYEKWLQSNPTKQDQSCIVYVSPDDIKNDKLKTKNGENFFGMLILPDIMMKEVSFVKKTVSGLKEKIQSFVSSGGLLMSTGKGAYLTETWGLVPTSTFSSRYTMINPKRDWQYLLGCDNVGKEAPVDGTEAEFAESTLCFSHPRYETKQYARDMLLSAPLLTVPEKSHGLRKIMWFKEDKNYYVVQHDEMTGLDQNLTYSAGDRSYPAVMYKQYGKGYVVVNMGNPAYKASTFQHVYNAFLLGASRPIGLDSNLVGGFNRTVPALEQVDINVNVNVVNYFTTDMNSAKLHVFTVKGTTVTPSSKCTKVSINDTGVPPVPQGINVDSVFSCTVNPRQLTNSSFPFSIRVIDPLVTQQKKDVVVLWPYLQYKDPNRANMSVVVSYGVKIQAAMSALLRADMNIDPSSWYPLFAYGTFIDNVMNCENKEETYAYRVQHVSVVPLVSPLIDILDQVRLATAMILDKRYYDEDVNHIGNWVFPFTQEGGDKRVFDYLEWDTLYNRSDKLAADWDEGVKLFREPRNSFPNLPPMDEIRVPREHIMNADYQTNNDDNTLVLKQFQFDDSDKFYEHAVQRLMAFLDVSTEGGAKTYWNGTIPSSEWKETDHKVGKRRILFVRHDIYFGKKYLMPLGLDKSYTDKYISLDRYWNNSKVDGYTYKGAFGNNVPDGMIPAEYTSKVQFFRNERVNLEDIEKLSGGKVKLIHYVVPVHPGDGVRAGDFYQFNPVTGSLVNYTEVQFKQMFGLDVAVAPQHSRRGGELVFTFDNNDLPWDDISMAASQDKITVSADQIAVYKIYSTAQNELRIRFKRGQMPNEAYGRPSQLRIFFEDTKWLTDGENSAKRTVRMDIYELHYDLAKKDEEFEDWSICSLPNQEVVFAEVGTFKLPALRLQFILNDDLENSFMNPYELREPLVRYSMYEQEILAHRAVHGSAEFHPKSEPCIVTRNSGFSTFTHVGTSSVPFREYVNTEISLQIPAATETGRVEWDDIWGRHFVQNVRSTIFEYPPIPPPLRNFVMTTTFEVLDKQGKRMLGGWRSNEQVDVHVQMKLLNNYPKWFEVTACRDNRVLQSCTVENKTCGVSRVYDTQSNLVFPEGEDDGKLYFKRGQNATYGICFADGKVRLEGQELTDEQKDGILCMTLCAKTLNSDDHSCETSCGADLPVLKRVLENSTVNGSLWNYADRVLSYWPEGYIKENMWDLTHYDYDDNQFDKAYKYHMDNNLPHLEHGITRPDNLIAFPLFKGLGYSMVYNKTYTNKRFPKYKGWWSDNLQNKDHTLVAGNTKSNDVSVGKESLIPDNKWVDITELHDAEKLVAQAEKNVYKCLFNRRSVKNYISNEKVTELFNVYENNIVPVPIDFNDDMEFRYKCSRDEWYTPTNISQYPNIVYTETPRDWLYFGANLRGGALEDINVIYQLNPLNEDLIKYEGTAKVQDGGRFVYWNPANSKNSYLVVDNPVHVVPAKRNDIEIAQEVIPSYTTTFDSEVYHHFTISDPEEIEREWESPVWTNNHGYGDFTVQVYVGDAGTTALPAPGTKIRVRYTFMNNAGFDMNMLKGAINSTEVGQESINAYEMMKHIVRTLRRPDAYNFLDIQIPEELRNYVKIYPCPDVVGIAPLFFDFDSINVVTIRDGWKGDYYLNIEISKDFPESLRGRLNEIPVKLVNEYFDMVPGVGDVTGVHDYTVEMPSIVFGVPYAKNHPLWPDKVFYTSGYATDVDPRTGIAKPFTPEEAIIVTSEEVERYRACLGRDHDPNQTIAEGEFRCLTALWEAHLQDHPRCDYTVVSDTSSAKTISFAPCMQEHAPEFPVKVAPVDGPDQAELHIMVRTHANQIKSGYPKATTSTTCKYNDWMAKPLSAKPLPEATVHAKGAWISLKWSVSLLSDSGMTLADPLLSPENSGLSQVLITLENTGDYYAYNVQFNLTLAEDVRMATENDTESAAGVAIPDGCGIVKVGKATMFWCNLDRVLVPYTPRSFPFRVYFNPDNRKGAGPNAKNPLNMRIIADKTKATIDLTPTPGEKRVTQDLEGPYGIPYTARVDGNMVVISAQRTSEYGATLRANHKLENVTVYVWRAKLPKSTMWTTIAVTHENYLNEKVAERFSSLGGKDSDEVAVDYVVAVSRTKLNVSVETSDTVPVLAQSNVYEWREHDTNLLLLLLLLPGLAIPAVAAAAIFATTKGTKKEAVRDIGMAPKEKFVPQELVDEEPIPMTNLDTTPPPPTVPQRAEPVVVPPEPAPQAAAPGKAYAIPTGPTYLRAGVPVNVVDS